MKRLESPEEEQRESGDRPARAPKAMEGGFKEGEHGRGPTPFMKSHSAKPAGYSIEAHMGDSGRGGSGILGGGDSFKGSKGDVSHPASHAEFEALGTDTE